MEGSYHTSVCAQLAVHTMCFTVEPLQRPLNEEDIVLPGNFSDELCSII